MSTIFVFNDWPKFRPSWNFAMNSGLRITSRECILCNSSVSVLQTWFCDEEITWLNFLPRYQITKHGDLTVQGHVIECVHISAEPVSGSLYQSRSRYQWSVLHFASTLFINPWFIFLLIIGRIPWFLKFSRHALITPIRDYSVDTELIRRENDSEQRVQSSSIQH